MKIYSCLCVFGFSLVLILSFYANGILVHNPPHGFDLIPIAVLFFIGITSGLYGFFKWPDEKVTL